MLDLKQPDGGSSKEPTPEYPDHDQMRAYGALAFLYSRSSKYDRLAFSDIRLLIQPPIDLRQFRIIEVDSVPRAAITWGFLSPKAEAKLIGGQMISPTEWRSGTCLWIMEIIAPYPENKLGARIVRELLADVPQPNNSARFPRYEVTGVLKHITEYSRGRGNRWSSKRLRADDLKHEVTLEGK